MRSDAELELLADSHDDAILTACGYSATGLQLWTPDGKDMLTGGERHRLRHLRRIRPFTDRICSAAYYDAYEAACETENQRNIRENLDYWHEVMRDPTDEKLYKFADWARNSEWSDKRD